jgi:hypothetical protein
LRFTINGVSGIKDLDMESLLETDRWYHIAAIYDGTFIQVYLDGSLDAFIPFTGQINTTTYDLVMGQSLPTQTGFDYKGRLDKVKIFNYGITNAEVQTIYQDELSVINEEKPGEKNIAVFPVPASDFVHVMLHIDRGPIDVRVIRMDGTSVFRKSYFVPDENSYVITIPSYNFNPGIYLILIIDGKQQFSGKMMITR